MAKIKLDLHDIYNKGSTIESELNRVIQEAVSNKISLIEIIPGKGSGQLKKKVLRFLNQKHIKKLYHRVALRQGLTYLSHNTALRSARSGYEIRTAL